MRRNSKRALSLGGHAMSIDVLRCRICATEARAPATGICPQCLGPLEPVYEWDEIASTITRASIEAGPRSLWRYSALLPAAPPEDATAGPGWAPRRPAPRPAGAPRICEVL